MGCGSYLGVYQNQGFGTSRLARRYYLTTLDPYSRVLNSRVPQSGASVRLRSSVTRKMEQWPSGRLLGPQGPVRCVAAWGLGLYTLGFLGRVQGSGF